MRRAYVKHEVRVFVLMWQGGNDLMGMIWADLMFVLGLGDDHR